MKNKNMIYLSSLILVLSPLFWRGAGGEAFAQSSNQNMTVTTQDAFYPKGEQALYSYVLYNVKYTEEAKKNLVEGNVTLSFDVMPDSTVKNVKIISDPGHGTGEGVKTLVETLKFAPAIQMGMKVKMNMIMDFPVKAH